MKPDTEGSHENMRSGKKELLFATFDQGHATISTRAMKPMTIQTKK